ncbi:hypothetical protein EII37_03825 [Streptococcus sp. OH4692_COT-348]|nr:hypothetical protein EII37_03825 [Streptococcus sp. OH4692_COT-348]
MVLKSLLSWRAIQICSTNEESTILDYSIFNVLTSLTTFWSNGLLYYPLDLQGSLNLPYKNLLV